VWQQTPQGSAAICNVHLAGLSGSHRKGDAGRVLRHISVAAIDGCVCAIGRAAQSASALAKWAGQIRLVGSDFTERHAPHSRRPRQPAGGPCCPLGRPTATDPQALQPMVQPIRRSPDWVRQTRVRLLPCGSRSGRLRIRRNRTAEKGQADGCKPTNNGPRTIRRTGSTRDVLDPAERP
jgi:hypothetical protein